MVKKSCLELDAWVYEEATPIKGKRTHTAVAPFRPIDQARKGGKIYMSPAVVLDLEVSAVVAVAVLIVALAAAALGACRDDPGASAAAEDVERALGDATLVAYAQVGEAARARQRCCAFCQSEYTKAPEELVRVVPACGHFFHAACHVDRWIRARRTCPLCRGALWPPKPRPPTRAAAAAVVVVA